MEKTSLNIDENIESLLCYLGVWITGLIFLILEKENKTVKFHAMQSFILFLPMSIVGVIFTIIFVYLAWIIWIIMLILWIILMVTSYQGQKFKIPIVGDLAEK